MATKEDILEQIVEEFLIHRGYFVRHNVKFRPASDDPDFVAQTDSNHSDIDVLGYHPGRRGAERVWAVSCKSYQSGFRPATKLEQIEKNKKSSGRAAWKGYRELVIPKWSRAFILAIRKATGTTNFTYVTAVTKLRGQADPWTENAEFRKALGNNPIKIITLPEMHEEIKSGLTTTLAGTEVGRMLQLFHAAGIGA